MDKNIINILSESANMEANSLDELRGDMCDILVESNEIEDIYNDIEEVEESIGYSPEMVNVVLAENFDGTKKYLIEFDNLAKYMQTEGLSAKEAVEKVCECNNISEDSTYVVIESLDSAKEALFEAKCANQKSKDKSKKEKIKDKILKSKKHLEKMKEDGVKLLKKKK